MLGDVPESPGDARLVQHEVGEVLKRHHVFEVPFYPRSTEVKNLKMLEDLKINEIPNDTRVVKEERL